MEAKINLYRTRFMIYFKSCHLKKSTRKGFDFKWSASLTDRFSCSHVYSYFKHITGLGGRWYADLLLLFNQLGNINRSWKLQQIQTQQLQVC